MNGAHVAAIGEEVDLTYPVEQLGNSPNALGALLKVRTAPRFTRSVVGDVGTFSWRWEGAPHHAAVIPSNVILNVK